MSKPKRPNSKAGNSNPKSTPKSRAPKGLPDRDTLLKYIRDGGETDKSSLAKAFGLKGEDRRALRHMLNGRAGQIDQIRRHQWQHAGR